MNLLKLVNSNIPVYVQQDWAHSSTDKIIKEKRNILQNTL